MQDEAAMSFRLSPQQEMLWSMQPGGPAGGAQAVIELTGPVDSERLHAALARVVSRHEILRTTFQRRDGMKTPLQVVHGESTSVWEEEDLGALDGSEQEAMVAAIEATERKRTWNYERGPLVGARLIALAAGQHVLVLTVAPPCADAASLATVAAELATLYGKSQPADDPLQYADFAEWQNELLTSDDEDATAGREFWAETSAASTASLPFLRPVSPSFAETVDIPLTADTRAAIDSAATRYGVAPQSVVHAALHVTIAKLTGEEQTTIGLLPSARLHAELETAVGLFTRPLAVSSRPTAEASFAEVMVGIQRATELAERWQDTSPLDAAPVSIGFVAVEPFPDVTADGVTFTCRRLASAPLFPVELEWNRTGCRLRFEPDALDRISAERTARYVGCVLAAASSSPDSPVGELELLDENDVHRLTVEVNQTEAEVPTSTIAELFATAAAAAPDRPAVVDLSGALTFGELDERANQVAHRLRRAGVAPGSIVGLCTDRSTEMVVGLLGILKAGAAYLPLNFEHPPARLGHQLGEAAAAAVVTQEALLHRLPAFEGEVLCLDRDRAELNAEPGTPPDLAASPNDLAYVIYTSGSTGTPKGVAVTNANLCNYVQAIARRLGADTEPFRFGMVSAISTDLGNSAVFPALCLGGTLVLVDPAVAAEGAAAAAFLRAHPIDVLKITPSHLNALLVGGDTAGVLPARWLVIGGEALSWDLVARVRELGGCRILNHYGPTETTVGSCTFVVGDADVEQATATVPIGAPIANTYCYVLDERGRCVPEGVPGELFIGGAGVARGYLGRPDLTEERFRPDPFFPDSTVRIYATGDLVRRLADGALEYLGRRDDQLKIRGFRVEPAEIEAALRAYELVREAAVVAREDGRGERKLVAYVAAETQVTAEQLRRHLADWIPDYMIPGGFVILEALPLTPSGKIDRMALPDPESASAHSATYIAPRTPVETSVAAIWADVLGLERVGVEDDFFALGGHSLLATQIVAQVRSDFSINLPLHALFTSPTVASLAQQIVELLGEAPDADTEQLISELKGLSDEEVALLLAADAPPENPTR